MAIGTTPVLVNGEAYDYTKITVLVLGVPLAGISSINYTEEQEKTNNFGTGDRPVSIGKGPIDASGSFEISMNDVEALRDVAIEGSLLKLPPFDIPIIFSNSGNLPRTHVLKNVEFTDDGVETSQGDTDVKRTFNVKLTHVKYR